MPTRDEPWPVGTPCWTDAQVDDPARAADFYGRLFGWQAQDMGEAAGGYLMCSLNDRIVAGIGPKPAGVHMPSTWTTHFASDDVERSVSRLSGAAGRCVAGPVDVFTAGRAAMATDAAGEWVITCEAGDLRLERAHAKADVALRATATTLLGVVTNRVAPERAEVLGDADLLRHWLTHAVV